MVNLEWYRSFVAIYRAGTVSGAARGLFLTQPAVTQHLAALESALGEPLFQRAPRRMVPTQRGKQLYSQIVQALETLEQVTQEAQSASVEQPLLRCGAPREYFSEVALTRVLTLPYRFWLRFGETEGLLEELEQEKIDAVIATRQIVTRDVESQKVDEESFCLVGSPEFVLPEWSEVQESDARIELLEQWLTEQTWISYGVELPIIRRFWQQSFGKRPSFQARIVLPDLRAIVNAVRQGGGMSILPEYLCQQEIEAGRLRILWAPPQRVSNELWLAYRKVDRSDVRIRQLRRALER